MTDEIPPELSADSGLDPTGRALLGEVLLGSARGGKKPRSPLFVSVLRSLGPEDVPALLSAPEVAAPRPTLSAIRHSHHQLARLIASGMPQVQIGLTLGYSQTYISNIKHDPAFTELVEHYAANREQIFVDVLERMKILGMNTLEELQNRLETEPEGWTKRELMELAKLTIVDPMVRGAAGGFAGSAGNGGAVNIEVKFVSADGPQGPIIDITAGSGDK